MRRGLLIAAAILSFVHGALLLSSGPIDATATLILGVDLAVFAALVLSASRKARASAVEKIEGGAELPFSAELEAETAAEPAPVQEGVSASSRLDEIRALAEGCLASCQAVLDDEARRNGAGSTIAELSTALSAARQSADLIHENTDKIFEIANNLANSAEQAFNLAHEVESRASSMAGDLAATLAETEGLLAESKRISDILSIMSEISSTTSILSFNASIVAANAGSHGKPFAVVAKEMRQLSESTEISLKDITTIVRNIQARVNKVSGKIRAINDGVKDEKESLVAVAGDLQGVMLANEVVRTVSGLCVQKSAEELESFKSMEGKVGSAQHALEAGSGSEPMTAFSSRLRKVLELSEKRA